MRLGRISRIFSPNYSWCLKCKTTWKFVNPHDTTYSLDRGMFPLCNECWKELGTPERRMSYYRELWRSWRPKDLPEWSLIEASVLEGK